MKNNLIVEKVNFIWRKKYLWFFICVGLFGSFLLRQFLKVNLNDILIFNTLVAILWYSRETMDLKQIANKQTEHLRREHKTNLRPYLRLQKGGSRGLILVNEGKGIAVNLRPVYKKDNGIREFLKVPAMATSPGSITESFLPQEHGLELDPSVNNYIIEVKYQDIEQRNYIAQFQSNPLFNDGFEIIKQEEARTTNEI